MTSTNGHRRAVLYARVSSEEQVKGYSLRQQLEALRAYAASEGYEVLEECEDPGYSGMFLDRPGLDRARDLVETGGVSVVLAQDADRITRTAAQRVLLDEEAERKGAQWLALDDWGDSSHEGKLLKFMKGWVAEGETLKITERSRRGTRRKISEGNLLGASLHPRYGFAYNADRTAYVIDPGTMAVVQRIFRMLADGHAIRAVALALDADGVPTPRGGPTWSRRTIREMALNDVYRPHGVAELDGLIPQDVLKTLDPEGSYGVAWSGRVTVRKVSNARRVRETPGRETWIGVPVRLDGSGLDVATVDRARRAIEGNRAPRKVHDRFFELASGPLRCAHCGRRMIGFARPYKNRPVYFYYRCDSPSRTGAVCPNRRSHPAEAVEYEATRLFEEIATRTVMLELYERAIAENGRRSGLHGAIERRTSLADTLAELEEERRGYLRQNARGVLSDDELDGMVAEVDERRRATAAEMRRVEDAAAETRRLETAREALASADWFKDPDAIMPNEWLTLGARREQIREAYMSYGARFELDQEGTLTMRLEIDLGEANVANGSHQNLRHQGPRTSLLMFG